MVKALRHRSVFVLFFAFQILVLFTSIESVLVDDEIDLLDYSILYQFFQKNYKV